MYPQLMQDFIADDHDHSVCAVAESVQIFTVPTLVGLETHIELSIFSLTALPCTDARFYSRWPLSISVNDIMFSANFYGPNFGRLLLQS